MDIGQHNGRVSTTEEPLSLARFTCLVLLKSDPGILSMGPPVFLFERTSHVGSGGRRRTASGGASLKAAVSR